MATFRLEVALDTAAFVSMAGEFDSTNLEDILRDVIEALENDELGGATLRDYNGNTVGSWSLGEDN
jgi:hypothetical protein